MREDQQVAAMQAVAALHFKAARGQVQTFAPAWRTSLQDWGGRSCAARKRPLSAQAVASALGPLAVRRFKRPGPVGHLVHRQVVHSGVSMLQLEPDFVPIKKDRYNLDQLIVLNRHRR